MIKKQNPKIYKQIKIEEQTHDELSEFCTVLNLTKSQFISGMIRYFKSNKPLITADFFQKSNKIKTETFSSSTEMFEKIVAKQMKIETNRLIGFLKTQDKSLAEFKDNLFFKLDKEKGNEYHPLFQHYDFVIRYIEEYLDSVDEDISSVSDFVMEKSGMDMKRNFDNSYKNITLKTLRF